MSNQEWQDESFEDCEDYWYKDIRKPSIPGRQETDLSKKLCLNCSFKGSDKLGCNSDSIVGCSNFKVKISE